MNNPVTILYFGQLFDQALAQYVVNALGILMGWLAPIAVTLVSIWVLLYGYATVRNETGDSVASFAGKALKMACILGVALSANVYMSWVVDGANSLMGALAGLFLQAGGMNTVDAAGAGVGTSVGSSVGTNASAWALVDAYDAQVESLVVTLGKDLLQIAPPFVNFPNLYAMVMVSLGGCFFEVCVLAVACFAKIVLTLTLSLGPLFILSLLFEATQRFFTAWLSKLLSAVMLSSVTFFLAGLSLSITGTFLAGFAAQVGTINFIAAGMVVGVIELLLGVVMIQAPTLAAALTSGAVYQSGAGTVWAVLAGRALSHSVRSAATVTGGVSPSASGGPPDTAGPGPGSGPGRRAAAAGGVLRRAAYKLAALRGRH